MRKTCLDAVYELAKKDPRVVFIGSDLGVNTLAKFKAEMPDRFFMEGVSEAALLGMAAGMAMEGKIVYLNTISTFITRRSYEQIVLDLCLHHANVRLIGSGGGVVYAPLGPTHLAFEDIAVLRTIPGMCIVAPCDAEEMKRLMPQTLNYDGPMYIRLGKGGDPVVSKPELPFTIGQPILYQEGSDGLLITTGITLQVAKAAAEHLARENKKIGILHLPTIKPIDQEALLKHLTTAKVILTIEEHTIIGGLGSMVAEILAEQNFVDRKRFKRIALPDHFPEGYGSQASVMERYSVTAESVVKNFYQLI